MVADDYGMAAIGRAQGITQGVIEVYFQWSGSYTAFSLILALAPFQPVISTWLPTIYILALGAACFSLLSELTIWRHGRRGLILPRLSLACWLSLFIYNLSHSEALYWSMASLAYVLPIPLLLLLVTLVLRLLRTEPARRLPLWLSVGLLMLASAGFGELIALSQVTLALLGILATLVMPQAWRIHRPVLQGLLLLALLGALIFFVAPGNWTRLSRVSLESALGLADILEQARINWLHRFSLLHWAVTAMALWGWLRLSSPQFWEGWRVHFPPLLSSLLALALWAGLLTPVLGLPILAYGYVPLRLTPLLAAASLASLVMLILLWSLSMSRMLSISIARLMVYLAFVVPLFALINNLQRLPDFVAYSTAWDAYDAAIRQQVSEGARELEVPPMPVRLGISDNEWLHEQRSWLNGDMARYYGLDDIRLNPEIDAVTRVR
jgi:hypothetical protein